MTIFIKTPRLGLRRPRMDDLDRIVALLNDIQIARNLAVAPHPYRAEHALQWLPSKCEKTPPDNVSLVIEKEEHGVIGTVGLHPEDDGAEIGYWIGRPHWGQGLMTEAVSAFLSWLFGKTDIRHVISAYFSDNPASWRVQEKLGFTRSGRDGSITPLARTEPVGTIGTILHSATFTPVGRPS